MAIPLIIVESPAKARTLKRFLGDRYDVRASMGHVRDLPEKELSVDVDRGFLPHYEVVESRRKTIGELRQASGRQKEVILASDPDREGEAIAWHLTEVLRLKDPKRIEFHEITPEAVRRALESPRGLDMQLVNAQQARRILDRLVGYRLSPFPWSKVQKGIGAGRVQPVALRLVVDREEEIRASIAVESWTLDALLSTPGDDLQFKARLTRRGRAGRAVHEHAGRVDAGGRGRGEQGPGLHRIAPRRGRGRPAADDGERGQRAGRARGDQANRADAALPGRARVPDVRPPPVLLA